MKWLVAAVGRGAPTAVTALVTDYRERLRHYGGVEMLEVADSRREGRKAERPGERDRAMAEEAARLRERIPAGALLVALDRGGSALTSDQWAQQVKRWREEGAGCVCFLIGGPDGLHPDLLASAHTRLSLGPLTFPHLLVRVLLLEQLYRAHTILEGIPYHR